MNRRSVSCRLTESHDQCRIRHIEQIVLPQLPHPLNHRWDHIAVNGLVRLVAVSALGVDRDAGVHTQQRMNQLLEIRAVALAEPKGDGKGLIVRVFAVQIIIAVHRTGRCIMVNVGRIQLEELDYPHGHPTEYLAGCRETPYIYIIVLWPKPPA